jgi:mitochondrial inner membrane protease ATP23
LYLSLYQARGGTGRSRANTDNEPPPSRHARSARDGMTPEKCESELDDISRKTPMVRFLLEALEKAGCPVNRSFFEVQRCNAAVLGGFRPDEGVVLCHNNLTNRTDMENMLTHELIHAYDHCR